MITVLRRSVRLIPDRKSKKRRQKLLRRHCTKQFSTVRSKTTKTFVLCIICETAGGKLSYHNIHTLNYRCDRLSGREWFSTANGHSPSLRTVERPWTLWSQFCDTVRLEGGEQSSLLALVAVHRRVCQGCACTHHGVERRDSENANFPQ